MKEIHIVRWTAGPSSLSRAFLDKEKALATAEKANEKRDILHRILGDRWEVSSIPLVD
jgi:hypothetical protein